MNNEKKELYDICLSQYIGCKCSICGREYKNLEILKDSDPVCTKNDGKSLEFGCKVCFETSQETIAERTHDAFSQSSEVKE